MLCISYLLPLLLKSQFFFFFTSIHFVLCSVLFSKRLELDPVKLGKNSIFLKNGKTVICCYRIGGKSGNFLDLG